MHNSMARDSNNVIIIAWQSSRVCGANYYRIDYENRLGTVHADKKVKTARVKAWAVVMIVKWAGTGSQRTGPQERRHILLRLVLNGKHLK